MLKTPRFILLLIGTLFLTGCFQSWSEKQKKEFAEQCEQMKEIDDLTFFVTGFAFSENDSIFIKQFHHIVAVDSFYVQVTLHDSIRDRYCGSFDKPVILNDTYHFIIPEEQTFVLSEMKTGMHPQFTMFSEGYGCRLREYKIDGKLVENSSNLDFVKEGYVFPWDR